MRVNKPAATTTISEMATWAAMNTSAGAVPAARHAPLRRSTRASSGATRDARSAGTTPNTMTVIMVSAIVKASTRMSIETSTKTRPVVAPDPV